MTKRPGSLIQVTYAVQKWLWRVIRPNTRGVKVMLFNTEGAIMLIRNSYGRSEQFVLPGGGVRPFEQLEAAAVREVDACITGVRFATKARKKSGG